MHPFFIVESSFSADHSLTEHARRINSLCRLCGECEKRGEKDRNRSKGTLCIQYSDKILSIFGINVVEDTDNKHSSFLCKKCQCRLVNFKNRKKFLWKSSRNCVGQFWKSLWYLDSLQWVSVKWSVCNLFPLWHEMQSRPAQKEQKDAEEETAKQWFYSWLNVFPNIWFCINSSQENESIEHYANDSSYTRRHWCNNVAVCERDIETSELSKDEEACLTKLNRIKMNQSSDKVTIRCKTQPLVFKKITQPRKPSTQAASPLKKKWIKFMARLRMNLSGNTADDTIKQQGAELKSTTKPKRKRILKASECKLGTVSEKEGPALRMKLGLSLTKYRVQKKIFRSIGVRFGSEQKQRQQQTETMYGKICVERSLEFWNEDDSTYDFEQTPVATITDIQQHVTELLDQYDKENQLTWHNSTIPEDEVWVKLGGDRGRGTFKLMLQIANLRRPNSKHNTCLLAVAECKDTPDNLRWIIGPYKHHITELETMQWREKHPSFLVWWLWISPEMLWIVRGTGKPSMPILYSIQGTDSGTTTV